MNNIFEKNKEKIIYGFLTVVISAIFSVTYYHLWGNDWRVPISGYRSDSVGMLLELNNYIRGGSVHKAMVYGAPYLNEFIASYGDSSVPMPLLKLFWNFTGSIEAAMNIHAVLNCIVLSLSTFWVCTRLKISNFSSMIAGIAYGSLTFFVMGCNTILMIYGACFYIPLFCYIMIELMREVHEENGEHLFPLKRIVFVLAVMLYLGMNSAYYAFLALILLVLAGLYTLLVKKSVDGVLIVVLSYIAIALGIATYTLPNILQKIGYESLVLQLGYFLTIILLAVSIIILALMVLFLQKLRPFITIKVIYCIVGGMAILAGVVFFILMKYTNYIGIYDGRTYYAVELGALKITNMVLPAVNSIIESVNPTLDLLAETDKDDFTVLGILSGIGMLYSILCIFQYQDKTKEGKRISKIGITSAEIDENKYALQREVLRICGLVNCFIIVVSVKGGVSSLIAKYITTGIRNYNRICVYLAVFSLISLGILIDQILQVVRQIKILQIRNSVKTIVYAAIIFGLGMSIPTNYVYNTFYGLTSYELRKKEYDDWQELMQVIEKSVPEGGMILELPFTVADDMIGSLMERGRLYEHAVPPILSKTTNWSYAGGSNTNKWKHVISKVENIEDFLLIAGVYDFQGIYIDTILYNHENDTSYQELLQELEQYLGEPYICNENRRFFYTMKNYNHELHEKYTNEELLEIKAEIEKQF